MADIYFDVDVALAEVPVNKVPLIDDTDFKSIEGAVAYNAGGMALRWHFVTSAGAYTVTSVTPTTGGDYDWTDQGDSGVYTIEIPASGGASINNDTEGYGWFTGVATGVLPWTSPIYGFRAAAINDALMDTNTAGGGIPALGLAGSGTLSGTHSSTTADLGTNAPSIDIAGQVLYLPAHNLTRVIDSYNTGTGVATFSPSTAVTLANGNVWYLYAAAPASTGSLPGVDVKAINAVTQVTPGAAGGLMIAGSNAATTFASFTVSGATIHTGNVSFAAGFNITQSTANTAALVVTGNGTGNGATITSGSGATGQALNLTSAATNGSALALVGAGSGSGLNSSGGASGRAATFTAGATGAAAIGLIGGSTSGAALTMTTTSGDGIQVLPTAGNALVLTANGTSKHGAVITGGTAGTSDGLKVVAGTGGFDFRGDITKNAMVESYAADGAAPTVAQALMLIQQTIGETSVATTTLTAKKLDKTTTAATYTLNDATTPTSRTRAT
jgi:hypothetical protein